MNHIFILLCFCFLFASCASSHKKGSRYPDIKHLIQIEPPHAENAQPATIYVDSVRILQDDTTTKLLVSGSFPDGCTHLEKASHAIKSDSLYLNLIAWRNPDMMCTQSLTPFSFVYKKVPPKALKNRSSITVNGTIHKLK